MKPHLLPFLVHFLSLWTLPAQNLDLVHVITQENISGNARYEAMSGAYGALGGNLSAIHINPAASAVFIANQFGLSTSAQSTTNNTSYFGTSTPTENRNSGLNQIGGVLLLKNNNTEMAWKKLPLDLTHRCKAPTTIRFKLTARILRMVWTPIFWIMQLEKMGACWVK